MIMKNKSFELIYKDCLEIQKIFVRNDEMIKSVIHLKDKIIRTPDNISSFFIKRTICSIFFPLSLIFNCSLATSSVQKQ